MTKQEAERLAKRLEEITVQIGREFPNLGAIVIVANPYTGFTATASTIPPEASLDILATMLVHLDQELGTGITMVMDKVGPEISKLN